MGEAVNLRNAVQHFVYFELDRDRIAEESFLKTDAMVGAQLKYTWRELEPEKMGPTSTMT